MVNTTNSNPIEAAVAPLKNDAMDAAEQYARKLIEKVREQLKAVDGDMEKAAPYPDSLHASRIVYLAGIQKRTLFSKLTKTDEKKPHTYRPHEPNYVVMDSNKVAKFVKEAREDAAAQYEAFIAKLVGKIGDTTEATLRGNHVWSFSFLDITKADGTKETWKTQTIINVSKLGKVFNQWPSRKMK